MKRIMIILLALAAAVYWQWPTIATWWDQWQADQAAQELVGDELDPELDAAQDEMDQALIDIGNELDAIEQGQ
ncbi:MAG TPA: hypothetical protein VJ553_03570 [Candidatus Paceibacterota bacterium]|nr:hypothetical protein [Candidatus Paceibacterota bacterium]